MDGWMPPGAGAGGNHHIPILPLLITAMILSAPSQGKTLLCGSAILRRRPLPPQLAWIRTTQQLTSWARLCLKTPWDGAAVLLTHQLRTWSDPTGNSEEAGAGARQSW